MRIKKVVALAAFYVTPWVMSSKLSAQCTKDIDCKGDRICVKSQCVDPPSSETAAPATIAPADASTTPPTEADVQKCVAKLADLGGVYGPVRRMEFGEPMQSQGGMIEMQLGAPKGTSIFPVKVHFLDFWTGEVWVYRDPFGSTKCVRHGDMDQSRPVSVEAMRVAIRDGEVVRVPVADCVVARSSLQCGNAVDQYQRSGAQVGRLLSRLHGHACPNRPTRKLGNFTCTY